MKKIFLSIGAVMAAVLVVVSAGCVTPSPNSSSPAGTPALPDQGRSAIPLPTVPAFGGTGGSQVAAKGDTVAVYYTGTFENGTVFDSNMNATKPVEFELGNSSVIQGFEEAVTGMSAGQQKTVYIPAEKAYGKYNASLVRTVSRTGPIANTTFVEGKYYAIHDRTTNAVSAVKILKVTPTTVTWDANDPLADLNFTFTIKLVKITRP